MGDEPKEDSDKGILGTLFGSTSVEGKRGLMFVGFIAPAGLAEMGRMLADPGQVESLLKKVSEEAAKKDAEKRGEGPKPAVGGIKR